MNFALFFCLQKGANFMLFFAFPFPQWLIANVFRYWHRSLNPRKLIDVKFSHLSHRMTLQRTMRLYKLPDVSFSSHLHVLFVSFSFQQFRDDFFCGFFASLAAVSPPNCYL